MVRPGYYRSSRTGSDITGSVLNTPLPTPDLPNITRYNHCSDNYFRPRVLHDQTNASLPVTMQSPTMDDSFMASLAQHEMPLSRTSSSERYSTNDSYDSDLDYLDLLHTQPIPHQTRGCFTAMQRYDPGSTEADTSAEQSTLTSPSCEISLQTPENKDWFVCPTAQLQHSVPHSGLLPPHDSNSYSEFLHPSPSSAKSHEAYTLGYGGRFRNKNNVLGPENMHSMPGTFYDDAFWCNQYEDEPLMDNDQCFTVESFLHGDATEEQLHSKLQHEHHDTNSVRRGQSYPAFPVALTGLKRNSDHGSVMNHPSEQKYLNHMFPQQHEVSRSMAPNSLPYTTEEYSLSPQSLYHSSYNTFTIEYDRNSHLDRDHGILPSELSQQSLLMEPTTLPKEPAAFRTDQRLTACKKSKIDFIIQCRNKGMSYKAIKALGSFTEAESTLRGMVRNSTKDKEERPRKPVWTDRDVAILRQTVLQFLSGSSSCHSLRSPDVASPITRAGERALQKLPWKQIAESMANRGCHLYGNATVKKKYLEIMGLTSRKQESTRRQTALLPASTNDLND